MLLSCSYSLVGFISLQRSGIELIAPVLHTRQGTLHCLYQLISLSSLDQTSRIAVLYPLLSVNAGRIWIWIWLYLKSQKPSQICKDWSLSFSFLFFFSFLFPTPVFSPQPNPNPYSARIPRILPVHVPAYMHACIPDTATEGLEDTPYGVHEIWIDPAWPGPPWHVHVLTVNVYCREVLRMEDTQTAISGYQVSPSAVGYQPSTMPRCVYLVSNVSHVAGQWPQPTQWRRKVVERLDLDLAAKLWREQATYDNGVGQD